MKPCGQSEAKQQADRTCGPAQTPPCLIGQGQIHTFVVIAQFRAKNCTPFARTNLSFEINCFIVF
jgi:hypothetical protein